MRSTSVLHATDYMGAPQVETLQVKEKFGTLRFYMGVAHDAIHAAIDRAEQESAVTCEACGAPGKSRNNGWISVLCDEHQAERQKKR